jgi:hypothetical protein
LPITVFRSTHPSGGASGPVRNRGQTGMLRKRGLTGEAGHERGGNTGDPLARRDHVALQTRGHITAHFNALRQVVVPNLTSAQCSALAWPASVPGCTGSCGRFGRIVERERTGGLSGSTVLFNRLCSGGPQSGRTTGRPQISLL